MRIIQWVISPIKFVYRWSQNVKTRNNLRSLLPSRSRIYIPIAEWPHNPVSVLAATVSVLYFSRHRIYIYIITVYVI